MEPVTNIAAYRFASLSDLKPLREDLLARCKGWGLKGTILLSTEGINLFVAGAKDGVEALMNALRVIPGLEGLEAKYSESSSQPFSRMLVRIKKEIIAFGVPGVEPGRRTSPKLKAKELKQWLDEGREVVLLDTRNDYEVKLGTFRNALPIGVDHFRHFPDAVRKLPEEMKEKPIVMFCTGGIRCEKAGPFMEMEGFQHIFQLDGGILKYFEECGQAHYDGECFVFDHRVGVDPSLHETDTVQCYVCQEPLTPMEQRDKRFVPGESCPHCFKAPTVTITLADREAAFRAASTPLPGSVPYENFRPLNVPAEYDQSTLLELLAGIMPHIAREEWQALLDAGKIVDESHVPMLGTQIVRAGERYMRHLPFHVEPEVNTAVQFLYEDDAIIVLNKPAPLPAHPGGRYNRNTLQYLLNAVYHPRHPRMAHRLDANTTGVVVLSLTRTVASVLQPQFTRGEVEKVYLAKVHGHPQADAFSCDARISTEPGKAGTRRVEAEGDEAFTAFRVLARLPDGTTLLEARPSTGRTNQIRLHLQTLGLPIVGDMAYQADSEAALTQTLGLGAPPLCLHSLSLSFRHPVSGLPVTFTAPAPGWADLAERP